MNKDRTINLHNIYAIGSENCSESDLTLSFMARRTDSFESPSIRVVVHLNVYTVSTIIKALMKPMKEKFGAMLDHLKRCKAATE